MKIHFWVVTLLLVVILSSCAQAWTPQSIETSPSTATQLPPTDTPIPSSTVTFTTVPTQTSTVTPTEMPPSFLGEWVNEDEVPKFIHRINISNTRDNPKDFELGFEWFIDIWEEDSLGRCESSECYINDFGGFHYEVSEISDSGMTIVCEYGDENSRHVISLGLQLLSNDRLEVIYSVDMFLFGGWIGIGPSTFYFIKIGE